MEAWLFYCNFSLDDPYLTSYSGRQMVNQVYDMFVWSTGLGRVTYDGLGQVTYISPHIIDFTSPMTLLPFFRTVLSRMRKGASLECRILVNAHAEREEQQRPQLEGSVYRGLKEWLGLYHIPPVPNSRSGLDYVSSSYPLTIVRGPNALDRIAFDRLQSWFKPENYPRVK